MSQRQQTKSEKIFGTAEPTNKTRLLTAGPLTALLDSGALRNIRYNGIEVLRAIAYLSRNTDWGTYNAVLTNFKVRQGKNDFQISYTGTCQDNHQELKYTIKIEAHSRDGLRIHAVGIPQSDFVTNRTGFVLLHPLEGVVGQPLTVTHTDQSKTKTHFPRMISPGQPVFDISALTHKISSDVTVTLRMTGDAFEMEDHRNWMDASYKTYVHSLKDIWPYTLKQGEPFEQTIAFSFEGKLPQRPVVKTSDTIKIKVAGLSGRMPTISTTIENISQEHLQMVRQNGITSFVAQLDGRRPDVLNQAKEIKTIVGDAQSELKLELILPAQEAAALEIKSLADAVNACDLKPASIVVTQAHDLNSYQPGQERPWGPSYAQMAAAARQAFPGMSIGGGVLTNFTELNRNPLPRNLFDFITHSLCPTVHASDDLSVMETLESLPWIFASVREMIGPLAYHIGPSSISARSNPYARTLTANPQNVRSCLAKTDPREHGLFYAVWSFGVIAACAKHAIANVAIRNLAMPALSVAGWFARSVDANQFQTSCSQPSIIATLACQFKTGKALWIGNLSREKQALEISGLNGKLHIQRLNVSTFSTLASSGILPKARPAENQFAIGPYELVLVTTEEG
jgi:D-apionolactonase